MRELNSQELQEVDGGFFVALLQAVLVGVAIFAAPKAVKDSKDYLGDVGQGLGEAMWEHNHPYDPNK